MKLVTLILLLSQLGYSQDLKLFYPELDAILITIWQQADEGRGTKQLEKELKEYWNEARPVLIKNINQEKAPHLIVYLDNLVEDITNNISENRLRYARSNSWELLRQFRKLRREYTSYAYPLDLLFDTYESFQEVDYAIHDQMFGLYYWFEFTDLTKILDHNWDTYNAVDSSELTFYYPSIDLANHQAHKQKFADCMVDFYDSLDTGYRPDFEMPCDEMGHALIALIAQYRKIYNDEDYLNRL